MCFAVAVNWILWRKTAAMESRWEMGDLPQELRKTERSLFPIVVDGETPLLEG
jgi:hypothetical protein